MKQIVAMMFVLAVGVNLSTLALASETVSSAMGVALAGTPPEKPEGDEQPGGDNPPAKPEEDDTGGDDNPPAKPGEDGGSDDSAVLIGAYQYTCETNTLAGATLVSTTSDQNVILAMTNAYVTISNCVLNKTGDMSSEDNSNFYAVNAVVASKTASLVCIADSTLNSNAEGANCLFASGEGSTIYAYNCTLTSAKSSSRGLDATYEGTVIAAKMSISTTNDHCAALATDRGNGYISATDSTLETAGQGSPLIYSTGVIEVNSVTGAATGAQIAGIEGLSTIRIRNSDLSGSEKHASEPVANGVIIYQSNSGDYTEGTATFEVSDSTLTSAITNSGAMFYITHSEAVITVQNTELNFDTSQNYLIKAAGNDGENGWGTEGSNGAGVVFTAIDQTLEGDISVDGISSNDLYLVNSTYTGTFVQDATYEGNGGSDLFIDSNSTWIVTASCTLQNLTAEDGATIVDGGGKAVSIVGTDGTKHVTGTSTLTITVSDYATDDFVATNITDFTISRTSFDAMYGTSGSEAGESGGSSGTGSKTYYFKPHAPTNGVVGVSYNGTKIYPDMDHKYWLDAYWTNGVTVTVDFSSDTTSGYFFADGSSVTSLVLTITENRIDIYPPAGYGTAYLAQAKSGSKYYATLKEAIDNSKSRATITLNDNVTLEETLTITNSITFNLATNVITLGSALTNAFVFTSKTATVSNGTINSSFATDVAGSVMLCFADCDATLNDLTIDGSGYEKVIYCTGSGEVSTTDVWVNGQLFGESSGELVTPGVASEQYEDAQSATNAADAINGDKAGTIAVPEGVEESFLTAYLDMVEATVTSDNRVVVDLTSEAQSNEQTVVNAVVTNETVFASLVSTNASEVVTISPTTPGLYYWIVGGTDVTAITNASAGVLSTNGGSVELAKPTLDAMAGKAFFRFAAGVSAPAQ